MISLLGIYILGVGVAFTLLLILAYYYDNVEKTDISDLSGASILSFMSWMLVIILLVIYGDKLIKGFNTLWHKNDDTKI